MVGDWNWMAEEPTEQLIEGDGGRKYFTMLPMTLAGWTKKGFQ